MNDTPAPGRRLLGCLVKGPLGCFAFLVGAAFVFVLFLPPVLGRLMKRHLNDWYGKAYHGSLEVGEAWIGSVYGNQRVESLILRDPEGGEVLNATVSAPPVPWRDGRMSGWGPVRVEIHLLSIVRGPDGRTNLERAFEPRSEDRRAFAFRPSPEELDFSFDEDRFELRMPAAMRFDIVIERLKWVDAGNHTLELANLRLDAAVSDEQAGGLLVMSGSCEVDGGTLACKFTLPDLFALGDPEAETAWDFQCDGRQVPTGLFEVLLGSGTWLESMLGPVLEEGHLTLARTRPDELRIEHLGLQARRTRVALAGVIDTGTRRLHGRVDDEVRVDFPAGDEHIAVLVPTLVPLFGSFTPAGEEGVSLVLTNYRVDLARSLEGLRARMVLRSGPARWTLDPGLHALVGHTGEAPERRLDSLRLDLVLHEGNVHFDSQKILGGNESYLLSGDYQMLERAYEGLGVLLPPGVYPSTPGEAVLTGDRSAPRRLE